MDLVFQYLLGLNPGTWAVTSQASRMKIILAGWVFIAFQIICMAGAVQFMNALTGNLFIGITGGLIAGIAFGNIVRLALITVVIRFRTDLEFVPPQAAASQPENLKEKAGRIIRLVNPTEAIRITLIFFVALAVAYPFVAIIRSNRAAEILAERKMSVETEFRNRHADYDAVRLEKETANIRNEGFPIYVYMKLAADSTTTIFVGLVIILAFAPYILLLQEQRLAFKGNQDCYFSRNGNKMKGLIVDLHDKTIAYAKAHITSHYPEASHLDIDPHAEFENPPFNTILKKPDPHGWATPGQWETFITGK